MENKVCKKCNESKILEEFNRNKKAKDGLCWWCRACNREFLKEYYHANKDCWRRASKEYSNNYYQQRRQVDPVFKFNTNVRNLLCQSFKKASNGLLKKSMKSEELLGCTFDVFLQHIQDRFTEGMSLDNYGEWHLDHIVPIATAKTEEDIIRLNHYTNFQPLWAKDNLSKGAKLI